MTTDVWESQQPGQLALAALANYKQEKKDRLKARHADGCASWIA